jgi:hypothetical protein
VKVFTFFYNRYEKATTSLALSQNGIDHTVLLHNADDLQKFIKGGTIHGKAEVTNNGKGLAFQRNSALDLMNTGEWAVFMSDDFKKVYSHPKEYIFSKTLQLTANDDKLNNFKLKKINTISLKEMFSYFPKLIELAEANNIHLIGFASNDNPRGMKNKFITRGLADGRFWLVRKNGYKFDTKIQTIDDYGWTCENLIRHKNVLVLTWTIPFFDRFTAGGFGTAADRMQQRKAEIAYMINKYDPLIKIAKKDNWQYGTHIKINASDPAIAQARRKLGMI